MTLRQQLEKNMKIEIPLPSHCHFVVRWVFKQAFLFLSSASITKSQGFSARRTNPAVIISERKSTPSSTRQSIWRKKIQNKEESSRLLREEIPVNVSVLCFYLAFFLSLTSSDHPQLRGERCYSGSKAGRILQEVRLEWKRASGGR